MGLLCFSVTAFGQVKRSPDSAFDGDRNRYLMVWEEADGGGTVIKAQFRNPDGSVGSGSPVLISDPRSTQGCFYGQFDEQNGDITTPSDCDENKNPTVSYNNGKYLVAWEVHGTAAAPSSSPDNQFINIFAQIIDAQTLDPLPGWEEGILISKVFIAANNAESRCGDRHACNDSQIQAWSKSKNPDVSPQLDGQGFIVTWQTNKDFIGCADSERRGGWAVYGRYINQDFSATSTTNPAAFAVYKDDSTVTDSCEPLSNVDNGTNPRIAVNQTSADFVIVYEVARANGGNASIGAKRVTLGSDNVGQVSSSLMPDIVAAVSGSSLNSPDVVSFKSQYVVVASDGSDIRAKAFSSESISSSEPAALVLGSGSKVSPRASTNLGIGGQRGGGANPSPERILLAFEKDAHINAATLNESLEVTRESQNVSAGSSENQAVEIASDVHNFLGVWQGTDSEQTVIAEFISSEDGAVPSPTPNVPPTAPNLLAPANGATFAPIRAFLSWSPSTDTDAGIITYNLYIGETSLPATPQVTGITTTSFIISPETETETGLTLEASKTYQWKIEADDGQGGKTSSPVRTLNTDNSVVGWWRFDDDPNATDCTGDVGTETVCDSSGLGNHGIPSGSPTWLPAGGNILGRALDLDGMNDFVTVPAAVSLDLGSQITVSCKINPNVLAGAETAIITKDSPASGPYLMNQTALNTIKWEVRTGGTFKTAASSIATLFGTHFRATGTFGASQIKLYFDATLQTTTPAAGAIVNNTNSLKIGRDEFTGGHFDGIVDECFILNKTISDAELGSIVSAD